MDLDEELRKLIADKTADCYADGERRRDHDADLVDRAERYGAELDDHPTLWEVVVAAAVGAAITIAAFALLWYIGTSRILPEPTDEPAGSPTATAGEVPPDGVAELTPAPPAPLTAALRVHSQSARVILR